MITLEKAGARVYLLGDTFAIKDKIKAMGGHWDGDRRAWWVGAAKQEKAAALVQRIESRTDGEIAADKRAQLDRAEVYGKATYKGRTYFVIGDRSGRLHLTVLDGSIDFWANADECEWTKRYEARERFAGYGRGNVRERQTLGGIRRFVEQQKDPEQARGRCTECDHWGPLGETCRECCEGTHA